MDDAQALRVAIDLMQVPSRVRLYQNEPLPHGMTLLLRVAAKADGALEEAETLLARPAPLLHDAATFFVEQILLAPNVDSYRVLGAGPGSTTADLRRNMALLLRWLHPDVAADRDRSVFAGRVATAWDSLKTKDRRSAYDATLGAAEAQAEANAEILTRNSRLGRRRRKRSGGLPSHVAAPGALPNDTRLASAAAGPEQVRMRGRGRAVRARRSLLKRLARLLSPRVC